MYVSKSILGMERIQLIGILLSYLAHDLPLWIHQLIWECGNGYDEALRTCEILDPVIFWYSGLSSGVHGDTKDVVNIIFLQKLLIAQNNV